MTETQTPETDHIPLSTALVVKAILVIYASLTTLAMTYAIGHQWLQWTLPAITKTVPALHWLALYTGTAVIVVCLGYRALVLLSWATAALIFPSARAAHDQLYDDHEHP